MSELMTRMDDALAQQIAKNTADELQAHDELYEYYDVYVLDIQELDNKIYMVRDKRIMGLYLLSVSPNKPLVTASRPEAIKNSLLSAIRTFLGSR